MAQWEYDEIWLHGLSGPRAYQVRRRVVPRERWGASGSWSTRRQGPQIGSLRSAAAFASRARPRAADGQRGRARQHRRERNASMKRIIRVAADGVMPDKPDPVGRRPCPSLGEDPALGRAISIHMGMWQDGLHGQWGGVADLTKHPNHARRRDADRRDGLRRGGGDGRAPRQLRCET